MANNQIPFKALDKQPLETRLYALIKLYQAADRMEFLNEGQKNNEELARISDVIVSFVNSAMSDTSSPEAENVIDRFPELMDLALTDDFEQNRQNVRKFMAYHNGIAFVQNNDFQLISSGVADSVKTKTLNEINAIVLETAQFKKSPYSSAELAKSITDNSLDTEERRQKLQIVLKNLQQLKKSIQARIVADWQVYKNSDLHNLASLADVIKQIVGRIDVRYQTQFKIKKSTPLRQPPAPQDYTPKQKANKRVRGYFSETSGRQYNRDYPETKIKVKHASKEEFLNVMGLFMQNGYNQYFSSNIPTGKVMLDKLRKKIEAIYPDNTEEALNRILKIKNAENLSEQQLEAARIEAFNNKSKEVFIKTLCASIETKRNSTKTRSVPKEFIRNSVFHYVQEMAADGTNNVLYLSTIDEKAQTWKDVADSKKEKYEEMTATVHHHRPIASTIDFYLLLHPEELKKGEKLETLSEDRLNELADKAEKLANNLGNHCLVFGSDVHNLLEADGYYSVSADKDNTVLACRYDVKTIMQEVQKMQMPGSPLLAQNVKENLLRDIEKYSNHNRDKNGIIRVAIDFSDHHDVENLRQDLSNTQSSSTAKEIKSMLTTYAEQQRA